MIIVQASYWIYPGLRPAHYSLEDILDLVCQASKLSKELICSRSRYRCHVIPRQVYCYIAKLKTVSTHEEIGKLLDGYNHSTVTYSIQSVNDKLDVRDKDVKELVETVKKMF